jgi:Tfp pilus assembly protein PilV
MMRRLLARLRDDRGFSVVELSVAMLLSSLVCASLVAVFFAFSQNSSDATQRARMQADARAMIAEIAVQLRQAIKADLNGELVESLSGDRIVFYTTNYDTLAPERVAYERVECVAGLCELWVHRYAMVSSDGIAYTFADEPFESSFLFAGVLSDQPIFSGIDWTGDPAVRTSVSSCTGTECTFPIVGITVRVRPLGSTSPGAAAPLTLHEAVRMRNA